GAFIPETYDVNAGRAHRAGDQADLAAGGRDGAFAMDPQRLAAVRLLTHVVVVTTQIRIGQRTRLGDPTEELDGDGHHAPAIEIRVGEGPVEVRQVPFSSGALGLQEAQAEAAGATAAQVMIVDRLSEPA